MNDLVTDSQISGLLTALCNYHEETHTHSLRVCLLSLDLGIQFHLSPSELWYLGRASLLHDIGKLEIPIEILSKPTALTTQEIKVMRQHVRLGFCAIQAMERELPAYEVVKKIAVAHHEFTTTPYPRSCKDDPRYATLADFDRRNPDHKIHYLSQIVAIADMTDALRHARAYKNGFTRSKIEYILRNEFQGDSLLIDHAVWRLPEETQGQTTYH
ncbi:MAG: HD domain-containing protein [Caldilineaceae bacterium]